MLIYRIHSKNWIKVFYLDAHILVFCAILEDLLQTGYLCMIFLEQLHFHKLLTHIFILNLDTLQYLALHEHINIAENPDNILGWYSRK